MLLRAKRSNAAAPSSKDGLCGKQNVCLSDEFRYRQYNPDHDDQQRRKEQWDHPVRCALCGRFVGATHTESCLSNRIYLPSVYQRGYSNRSQCDLPSDTRHTTVACSGGIRMSGDTPTRRQFLTLGSLAVATGLAGCSTSLGESGDSSDQSPTGAQSSSEASVYTQVYRDTISSVVMVKTDQGQGTGFLYDDSHIVTNAHVVGRATSTQLRFHEGTWSGGEVQGRDVHSDLAVITAESTPSSAQPLSFVDDAPAIGQEVVAIGNPYNLDGSVTTGIVSGTDRLIPSPSGYQIPDAIQTDAAVNPGNSGGPLMSLDGSVVGVVNSKRGDNIAFGISAALTQRVVPRLIETGEYEHAYLGVGLETMTPTIAEANDLSEPRGLLVVQIVDGGPADGVLQPSELRIVNGRRIPVGGDVILGVDGTTMHSFEDLASYLALQTRPGDTIQLRILRNGSEQTVEVTLASRPERAQSPLR